MAEKHNEARPEEIPFDELKYELTPSFVRNLTWAHENAGAISAMRFSPYGDGRLNADAHRLRITYGIHRAGYIAATLEDVSRLLVGDIPDVDKRSVAQVGRRVAVLAEAARQLGGRGDASTPETFATYLEFMRKGSSLWSNFVGRRKEDLLEIHRGSVEVGEPVAQLYAWIDDDELLSDEPLLRAATLYWGLSIHHPERQEMVAVDAVVQQELMAGGIDCHGLLVLQDLEAGFQALRLDGIFTSEADYSGDLTGYLEHYVYEIARALVELRKRLEQFQAKDGRSAWMMTRPPDALDRQIFDVIEKLGRVRSQDIIDQLNDPPPLRTLQRRLRRLVQEGLIVKQGSRKFSHYQLAEHP